MQNTVFQKQKDILKPLIKPSIRILCFLLVFVGLVELLSVTYFSRAQASNYNNKYSETMSFYNEPENTLQIVAVGNSNLYSGFCPQELWTNYGFTSTAIGAPRQTPQQSFDLLKEALDNQSPSLVIIECDMLYDEAPNEVKISSKKSKLDIVFDYLSPDSFEEGVKNIFPLFTFHDKWKNNQTAGKSYVNHGYKYSDIVNSITVDDSYMSSDNELEEINRLYYNDMCDMIEYCRMQGIEVVLINLPSPASWNTRRHNSARDIADKMNVPYIDINTEVVNIGLDFSCDFRDDGNHLNYNGAIKATDFLGEFIKANYLLEDKRNDANYAFWQKSYDDFIANI